MKRSPLQVENYFLRELSFKVNEDYDDEKPLGDLFKGFQYFTDFFCYDKASHKWQCALGLRYTPGEGDNNPYSFLISLVGYFTVDADVSDREVEEKLIHANAPAVLYTIAREVLSSTSARARWKRINLPTVYFPPVTSTEDAKKPSAKRTLPPKKKKKPAKKPHPA
jgi:preprotein translocase subunit SecB